MRSAPGRDTSPEEAILRPARVTASSKPDREILGLPAAVGGPGQNGRVVVRVEVQPDLIRWANARSRVDESVLAHRFPKLEAWEHGDASPTLNQLEDFAKATHPRFDLVRLDTMGSHPHVGHRSGTARGSAISRLCRPARCCSSCSGHPKAIQERLGHSTINITLDRYGHLFPALDEALTERLEEMRTKAVAESSSAPNPIESAVIPLVKR